MDYSRKLLIEQIEELGKALPTQAPLNDFVHFNPLMHYESLPFAVATRKVYDKTGALCYLSSDEYRKKYDQGRITDEDLIISFTSCSSGKNNKSDFDADSVLIKTKNHSFTQQNIALLAFTKNIPNISYRKLLWKIEEDNALEKPQENTQQVNKSKSDLNSLWQASLKHFDLDPAPPHFNEYIDISLVEIWQEINQKIRKADEDEIDIKDQHLTTAKIIKSRSKDILEKTFSQVGQTITMRSVLMNLTDTDVLVDEKPILFRQLSAWLDLGMTGCSKKNNAHSYQGFYEFWKDTALNDLNAVFEDLITWKDYISSLSDDPIETIISELMRVGIPEKNWGSYLECLALEIPGWSGMFNWRHNNKAYQGFDKSVEMADYLAVRIVTEHLFCRHITRDHWNIDATLPDLRGYFKDNLNEFFVRYQTYNTRYNISCNEQLPEYLLSISDQLLSSTEGHIGEDKWHELAHLMLTWLLINEYVIDTKAYTNSWRFFHLAQHLGLTANEVSELETSQIQKTLALLEKFDDPNTRGHLWLQAYENNYKQTIYQSLLQNHNRGNWPNREARPQAQLIFCMDDREESIRRHLEQISPQIETIGAAGVFGLPNNFKSLDTNTSIKLAQPVVTAVHQFDEVCDQNVSKKALSKHQSRYKKIRAVKHFKSHALRQSVIKTTLSLPFLFPISLIALLGGSFQANGFQNLSEKIKTKVLLPVKTRIQYNAQEVLESPTLKHNQLGLSPTEKIDKVAAYLNLTGYTSGFSRVVTLVAHSTKQINNPHVLAYGCGACSGRYGGPNARVFCSIVNEPEIRAKLSKDHNIEIPKDTWFIAAEHDTTSDIVEWFDTDLVPEDHQDELRELQNKVIQASKLSAIERCQRFASAPKKITPEIAYQHVQDRAASANQPRAELGHQGCAAAFIGRRSMHQGISWDRRTFMVSYDPFNDPVGKILEAQLLGNGVVGIGITMDYYFSTIQNGYLGSGNKTTHNVTGQFGVMNGTSSDLQTGLARQMTELHEPMRLLVVLESTLSTVEDIINRQAAVRNLVKNQWLTIAVKNPETAELHEFDVDKGFVPV